MSENTTIEKGLFETLEDRAPEHHNEMKASSYEHAVGFCEEEKFEFLVQDMFMDHFFP